MEEPCSWHKIPPVTHQTHVIHLREGQLKETLHPKLLLFE